MCMNLGLMSWIAMWLLMVLMVTLLPMLLVLHVVFTQMWGILINLSAAVCAVCCKSGNINKLYCRLVIYYIKVMPFVYSKLFSFRAFNILLWSISHHSYCISRRG